MSARRAVVRWGLRLFRREWRQQALILALLTVAVAAATLGLCVVTAATPPSRTTFTLSGTDPAVDADVAAIEQRFGSAEAFVHHRLAVPGSVARIDLRSALSSAAQPQPLRTLRLRAGRQPTNSGEVALTRRVAGMYDVRVGSTWRGAGRDLQVVGLVENPQDLNDQFALVAPGQVDSPESVTVQVGNVSRDALRDFRLPSGAVRSIEAQSENAKAAAAVAVLAMATVGLLFVGLVGVAGFSVMAQRRTRAIGMLGSIGATDSNVRLVALANGAAVGVVGGVIGAAAGLAGWFAFAPHLETMAARRINPLDVLWWAVAAAVALAVVTAVAASWWPARATSRMSIVSALSGRPPRPRPAGHFAVLGSILGGAGLVMLAMADQKRALLIAIGIPLTVLGVLLLAPLTIRALASAARGTPVAVRLALRDLSRYQSRSGAALGAATLAIGIAVTISLTAAGQIAAATNSPRNLDDNQLVVYLSPDGNFGPLPELNAEQMEQTRTSIGRIASALGTRDVVALDMAVNPSMPAIQLANRSGRFTAALAEVKPDSSGGQSIQFRGQLFVATPEILARYGIRPADIATDTEIISSLDNLAGLRLITGLKREVERAKIQAVALPRGTSEPNTLITAAAMERFGLERAPAAWIMQADHPLTNRQIDDAQKAAAGAGLTIETQTEHGSLVRLGHQATAVGILFALVVVAIAVGLIRSEAANDLRVLTATGASAGTRRTLTGATTGALALLGALLGTAVAYLALTALYRSDLHRLSDPPVANLALVVVGFPIVAIAAGWLLGGREPSVIARRPIE